MGKRTTISVLSCVFAFIVMCVPGISAAQSAPQPVCKNVVTITMDANSKPTVDCPIVHLYKKNGDSVTWQKGANTPDWVVIFDKGDGTPFGDDSGTAQAIFSPNNNKSKKIIANPPDPTSGQTFRYRITLQNGQTLDPIIIIH